MKGEAYMQSVFVPTIAERSDGLEAIGLSNIHFTLTKVGSSSGL
jgi:hypothetical protein